MALHSDNGMDCDRYLCKLVMEQLQKIHITRNYFTTSILTLTKNQLEIKKWVMRENFIHKPNKLALCLDCGCK